MFNAENIETWFQNGLNSVRIRFENKKEVVFTYNRESDWKLETISSFMKTMNKK